MFHGKSNKDGSGEGLYNTTIIGKDFNLNGNIDSMKNIRLDGKIDGIINCQGKVIIGKTGRLQGEINTQDAEVYGLIQGKIKVLGTLELKNGSDVRGEIYVKNLISEQGAKFNGTCYMDEQEQKYETNNIVEISNE